MAFSIALDKAFFFCCFEISSIHLTQTFKKNSYSQRRRRNIWNSRSSKTYQIVFWMKRFSERFQYHRMNSLSKFARTRHQGGGRGEEGGMAPNPRVKMPSSHSRMAKFLSSLAFWDCVYFVAGSSAAYTFFLLTETQLNIVIINWLKM